MSEKEAEISLTGGVQGGFVIDKWDQPNPWERISEIAAKVGVAPTEAPYGTIVATGKDGKLYDVWEVVSRTLDKIAVNVNQ